MEKRRWGVAALDVRKEKADRVRLQSWRDIYVCKEQSASQSAEGILCLYT